MWESFSGLNKLEGYKEGIRESGLELNPKNIIRCERTLDEAKKAIFFALDEGTRFSAVLNAEDVLAVGALKALAERKIDVPNEVAVVGFNNSVLSECSTPALYFN